ncbi:hypothetical protein D3C84_765000 [compost metagenome]
MNWNRIQPFAVVSADRRQNNHEHVFQGRRYAECRFRCNDVWTNVERSARFRWNPLAVNIDERAKRFAGNFRIDRGNAQTLVGAVKTLPVLIRAEQYDTVVVCTVRFKAFENRLAVVEHFGSWIKRNILVRNDASIVPALACIVIHNEHVIGVRFAEYEIFLIWTRLWIARAGNRNCNFRQREQPLIVNLL